MPNGPADVASGAPSVDSYTDNRDGTVTDNVTKLMWQQTLPGMQYAWADAVTYCSTLALAGHSDWRLPSFIELTSILNYGVALPAPNIDATAFPGTPAAPFWCSTPVAGSPTVAWTVNFNGGGSFTFAPAKTVAYDIRCVR